MIIISSIAQVFYSAALHKIQSNILSIVVYGVCRPEEIVVFCWIALTFRFAPGVLHSKCETELLKSGIPLSCVPRTSCSECKGFDVAPEAGLLTQSVPDPLSST